MQKLSQKERIELLKARKNDMKRRIEAKKAAQETQETSSTTQSVEIEEVKDGHGEEIMIGLVKPDLRPD